MHIVVTEYFRISVPVMPVLLVIHTKHVDLNERHHAVKHHVELELNVVKTVYRLIVFAHPVTSETHLSNVTISTNVPMELVVRARFALTHQEATIVNVNQDLLG